MATEHDAAFGSSAPPPSGGPSDEARPPRSRSSTTRRAALIIPIVAIATGLVVVIATLPGATLPTPTPTTSGPAVTATDGPTGVAETGYLTNVASLRERAQLAANGAEPYRGAADDLLEWAAEAVDERPEPVDPILIKGTDGPFVDDARRAYGLGLAYVVTGDERYASAARATIRAWVDTARQTTDTCPDSGSCHTSLIIGRAGAGFAMGADLIAGSPVWTAADRTDLRAWMRDVLLPAASQRPNNWGDAGTFLRVVAADYAGDDAAFEAAIAAWRANTDLIERDGRIPEEVRRGQAGISYTQEALQYKVAVAEIAARRGIDLWSYQGRAGGSLRAAIDRLAYYWFRPEEWPDHPDVTVPSTGPLWEIAYARFGDPRWQPIIQARRPYGDRGHSAVRWTTLTHGVPFQPVVAGTSPSPSPVAVASPTPTPTPTPSASATPMPSAAPSGSPATAAAAIDRLTIRLRDPWSSELPVRIGWRTDPADADVVAERAVDGGDWRELAPGDDERLDDEIPIDTPVDYRVRSADGTTWSTIDDARVDRFEATSGTVDQNGSWARAAAPAYSGGSALSTDQSEALLTWRGTARSLFVVGPVGPTRGRMVIDVDGERAEVVELYSPSFEARTVLFAVHWSDGEEHEVRIEARHRSGRTTVAVDDLVSLSATVSVAPAPAP